MTGTYIVGIVVAIIIAAFLLGYRNNKIEEKLFREKCAEEFGSAPSVRLKKQRDDLSGYLKAHNDGFVIDDITWNDLGMDFVYDRINYCETSSGVEYLYYMLRAPRTKGLDSFDQLEKELSGLSDDQNMRIRIKESLHRIGKTGKYSIYDYLPLIDEVNPGSNLMHILVLLVMVIGLVVMCFNFMPGFLILIISMAYNLVSYFRIKAGLDPYLVTFSYVLRLVRGAKELSEHKDSVFSSEISEIMESIGRLKGFTRGSFILMSGSKVMGSGNPLDIFMDYVRMLTHIDLIKFNLMHRKLKNEIQYVHKLTENIGYIDSVMSICYYRASLENGYCKPDFENKGTYEIEEGRHPLMKEPVPNSFKAEKGFLITGSNASGKSTFLKMCAINTIFAQSIHTCLAKSYKAPVFRVFSSMALKDDLKLGDSYYMVEIKSLKRILDAVDDNSAPVLCFIDEVLRGTNTIERIAASSKILEFFANDARKIMCFAATHDGELSDILKDYYEVYHFEGELNDNDVCFDFKLKKGPATKRNAINLLRTIGYKERIVEDAEEMAIRFEKNGVWSL
ncbi:MutS-related protein [Butyrivibrio sp. LC3010]|uniref:MutS-related protein n=1 Tax=Butyrivibrio sp. LC3010 TaxID=1280680 RepID=UPI00041E9691|nr:MutS family DNA mismatch repair protein [Butyrivibrio sp. LC3010]